MSRKTLQLFIVLLLATGLLLASCSTSAPATEETVVQEVTSTDQPPTPSPTKEPASIWPMTLIDGLGRQVTLEAAPERIVSLSPSNTEILYAAGAGSLVVGNTEYCDYPEEAQSITKVGGFSASTISVETIVSLEPDLVLANDSGHGPVIEALDQANIPVYAVQASSFEDIYSNLELVGMFAGSEDVAAKVVEGMKVRIAAVEEATATVVQEERPTVFWEIWDDPLMTSGSNTFSAQMIEIAGGVSIFSELTEDYPQVSVEEVVSRNPAVIMGPDTHGDKLVIDQLADRPGWEGIEAVIDGRIYLIDGDSSSRPGPRLVDALEEIAAALHPELFE